MLPEAPRVRVLPPLAWPKLMFTTPAELTLVRVRLFLSSRVTALAPVLVRLTPPPKSLPVLDRLMAKPPVLTLVVPGTVTTPAWETKPPAVTLRAPVPARVVVGRVTAPLGAVAVKFTLLAR